MNRLIIYIGIMSVVVGYSSGCLDFNTDNTLPEETVSSTTVKNPSTLPYNEVYNLVNSDSFVVPRFSSSQKKALYYQSKLFKRKRRGKKNFTFGQLSFSYHDLERTVKQLESWDKTPFVPFSEYFNIYAVAGKQKKGDVLYTGYYSPILLVSHTQSNEYPYPIYTRPKEMFHYPTRKEIYENKALENKNLELAYAKSLIDIQIMQLQGSGYVQYENGELTLFSYGGSNLHPRKSIQRYFKEKYAENEAGINMHDIKTFIQEHPDKANEILYHNPSYIFFIKNPKGKKANGSGNVPLTAEVSIATDSRYLPTGACFLAELPHKKKSELTLLLAQDVGGSIRGHSRLDLYTGVGKKGKRASRFKGNGRLWLILTK